MHPRSPHFFGLLATFLLPLAASAKENLLEYLPAEIFVSAEFDDIGAILENLEEGPLGELWNSKAVKKLRERFPGVSNENNEDNSGFERTISDNFEEIGGFKATKVTTKMMGNQGPVLIEEWFTTDTTLFKYVSDIKTELVVSYGGENQQSPRSFSEMMLTNQGHEFESIDGRMVKYKMERKDEDDDDGFTMLWQIKSAKKMPFNRSDFELPKDHKKVDKLD